MNREAPPFGESSLLLSFSIKFKMPLYDAAIDPLLPTNQRRDDMAAAVSRPKVP